MTLEAYLQLVAQLATAVVVTMALFAVVVVATYYCYKGADNLIRRRNVYIRKLKKSVAFPAYNDKAIKIVPKNGKKAVAK